VVGIETFRKGGIVNILEFTKGVQSWDQKVDIVLKEVNRRGNVYLTLGLGVYGGGSAAIMYFMRNSPALATLAVMLAFQLCIVFFSTKVIFPCIGGGFWIGLLANRDSIPTFDRLGKVLTKLETKLDDPTIDIRGEAGRIREELSEIRKVLTKPVAQPITRIGRPPMETANAEIVRAGGNGG
jgi:hypothetical protein